MNPNFVVLTCAMSIVISFFTIFGYTVSGYKRTVNGWVIGLVQVLALTPVTFAGIVIVNRIITRSIGIL